MGDGTKFGFFGYCGSYTQGSNGNGNGSYNSGSISNLNMAATVTCTSTNASDYEVGSVVGTSYCSIITGCTNTGTVTGPTVEGSGNNDSSVGGIAGYATTVENCTNYGTIMPGKNYMYSAGGIIGYGCTSYIAGEPTCSGCTNYGTVAAGTINGAKDYGFARAGGIAGFGSSVIFIDCTNSGRVNGGTATNGGEIQTGGIIGRFLGTDSVDYLHLCHNTGEVVIGSGEDGNVFTGGLVGYMWNGPVVYDCCTTTTLPDTPIGGAFNNGSTDLTPCTENHGSTN